jgi:hypothetical protein
MHQTDHAQAMADRFRELVEEAGDSLSDNHYEELKLIIEAGLDAALIENMDNIAAQLNKLAVGIQKNAKFFDRE